MISVYRREYYDITHFTFHKDNGTVILDSERMRFFNAVINSFKADNPESEPYIILEFHIEKYRSISDYQGFVSEENSRIALMQAAHTSILEYMYQHSIATKTQKKLSQAAYTTFITFVSVMASMVPITIGSSIGSAASSIANAGTAATTTVSTLTKAWCIAKSVAVHVAKLVRTVAFEILEELYLDPWIEATVSTYMAESGADLLSKAFATSFAESIRETLMGGVTGAFRTAISNIISIKTEVGVDTTTSTSLDIQDQISEMNEALQAQEEAREQRRILFQVAASTLALLTAPFGGMAFASIGYSVGTSVYGTYRTIDIAKKVKTGTNEILAEALSSELMRSLLRQVHPLPIHVESDMEQSQFEFGILPGWDDPIADDDKFDWFSDIEEDVMDGATSMLAEEEIIIPSVMETHMTGWGMGAGILGNLRMPSIHLSFREGSGNERATVIKKGFTNPDVAWKMFIEVLKNVLSQNRLVDTMEFKEDPNYVENDKLQKYIDLTVGNIRNFPSRFRRDYDVPNVQRIAAIYLNLFKYVKTEIGSTAWHKVETGFMNFFNSYRQLVGLTLDFEGFRQLYLAPSTLSYDGFRQLSGVSTTRTPIRDSLGSWLQKVFLSEFPRYKDTGNRRGFSGNLLTKIFYNKNSRVGVFSASGHEYINLYKLFELLYLNEKITVSKLRQLGISEANEFSVQRLKESIKKIVKSFIFGNPFERKYIHARSSYIRRSASYFAPEYDLCSELYIAFSKENNRPLSHKEFAERLGGHFGFLFARAASPMSWRTLTSLIGEFKGNFYQIGTLRKELTGENYRRASSAIREYLSRREVTASKKEYNQDWLNPDVIDFHIIALLLRDLGIGIGSLEKIDSISFKISLRDRFKFERHHIFKNDKKFIDPNRIVLVLKGLHPYLENLDAKLINTLIDQMLDWSSDSCPDYYKNSYPDTWREQWAEVIDRRNFIKKEGVGRFLLDFYPDVIERVFGSNVAARTIELGIRGMIHSWIQKYKTIPKLPNTILSKLGLVSSQVQITNFLGNPNP